MEPWNLIKNNKEDFELLKDSVFIIFTLLNFFLLYRSRPKKAILKFNSFDGELFRFQRGDISRAHLKMDFDLSAENDNIYPRKISISNPKAADLGQRAFSKFKKINSLYVRNIRFYLRNWASVVDSQEGWEYEVMTTAELPILKVLINHPMQYRNMGIHTERRNNFRDDWGRIKPQEWSHIDGSFLIEKNFTKHVTILCELTFENMQNVEVDKLFSINSATFVDIKIEFDSRILKKRVMLKPASLDTKVKSD
jgi:hypothetical protein